MNLIMEQAWTELNDLNKLKRVLQVLEHQHAAFLWRWKLPAVRAYTELTWNGSSWTEVNDLNS